MILPPQEQHVWGALVPQCKLVSIKDDIKQNLLTIPFRSCLFNAKILSLKICI